LDELLTKFVFFIGGEICNKLALELEKLGEKEITDQELAEKLGEDINTTRKNLYKLLDFNLVTYRRTRDKKNGWIIFYFKANFVGYENILIERNLKQIENWKSLLEYEKGNMWYTCDAGCTRVIFDKATEMDFRCPQCESLLNFKDNSQRINDLLGKIQAAEKENDDIRGTHKRVPKKKVKTKGSSGKSSAEKERVSAEND
jgi:transcription initiation factor TFIIE subunit alpha